MKEVIKKTASSRKPVEPPRGFIKPNIAKKPKMQSGGAKKPLRKAKDGKSVEPWAPYTKPYPGYKSPERITKGYEKTYQGPLNKAESDATEKGMMSPEMQNYMRAPQQSTASYETNKRKKGGATKSTNKKNTTMKKLVKADKGIQIGKKKSNVSVTQTVDGKDVTFTGTAREGKRKAITNLSNPDYGSTKSIEKFNRTGGLKTQKFIDKDTSGSKIKVTKNKVDKEGNIQSSVPYQRKKGGAIKAVTKKTMVKSKKK